MRSVFLSLIFFLFSLVVYCQQEAKRLLEEGIELHDKGQFEEAIKKYDSAISIDKIFYMAYYEKSYTFLAIKKYEECIELSKFILNTFKEGQDNAAVYINYGTCLDILGKPQQAIVIYDEGIKKYSSTGLLYFNKAITLYNIKEVDKAVKAIKLSLLNNPYHASSHHLLSIAVYGNNVYRLLASLMFLMIEPTGKRGEYHLQNAETLIGLNVKKTGEKSTTITMAMPDEKKKKSEDDFRSVEVAMSLSAALNYDEKNKDETPVERMKRNLEMVFSMLSTSSKDEKGFGWTYYGSFFAELNKENFLDTFCHKIYASTADVENNKWLESNTDKLKELNDWFKSYNWNKNN